MTGEVLAFLHHNIRPVTIVAAAIAVVLLVLPFA